MTLPTQIGFASPLGKTGTLAQTASLYDDTMRSGVLGLLLITLSATGCYETVAIDMVLDGGLDSTDAGTDAETVTVVVTFVGPDPDPDPDPDAGTDAGADASTP